MIIDSTKYGRKNRKLLQNVLGEVQNDTKYIIRTMGDRLHTSRNKECEEKSNSRDETSVGMKNKCNL